MDTVVIEVSKPYIGPLHGYSTTVVLKNTSTTKVQLCTSCQNHYLKVGGPRGVSIVLLLQISVWTSLHDFSILSISTD